MSRRRVLNSALCILVFVPSASSLASEEDPLDSFGKQLSGTAGNTPAPQSAVNSAVTHPTPQTYSGANAFNLQQAIDESLKKKRIDPRTHG